jgi:hypothetical protein
MPRHRAGAYRGRRDGAQRLSVGSVGADRAALIS